MTKENIETICQMIEDNNSLSINHIAREVGIDEKFLAHSPKEAKAPPLQAA